MKQYVLKSIVSSIILIGHFLIIILILEMYFRGGFTFSEATTAISVFLPITSVYTSTIINDIIANMEIDQRTKKRYSLGFALISCIITLMFIIYLVTIIIAKAYNLGIADFEQFKALLDSWRNNFCRVYWPNRARDVQRRVGGSDRAVRRVRARHRGTVGAGCAPLS
jgi:hypothetical protein